MVSDARLAKVSRVVEHRRRDIVVVLEDIYDPHNAQAIFRTCEVFGIQNIYLISVYQDEFDPKSIGKSSSSSANKWLDFTWFTSTQECFSFLKSEGYEVIVTALTDESQSLQKSTFSEGKIALVLGNEHRGVTDKAIELSDRVVKIDMFGMTQSLNVSVSTALCLYEMLRQRENVDAGISDSERKEMIQNYLDR
jgi:tRNA (guanosine-2'-O-)-methyltransferase